MLDIQLRVLLPTLEVLGTIDVVVADAVALQVNHTGWTDEEVEGKVADELAAGHEMRRRVEVRADVERHRDLLASRAVEGQVLDPPDRWAGIAGERRRVKREVLGKVEVSHFTSSERCTLPIALRGRASIVTTRFGHL